MSRMEDFEPKRQLEPKGLNIEVATDNERYLIDLMSKGLAKSNARAYHWRNISEYRPQAKGVERAVCIAKEGIYTNWLAFEVHCQCRIALESPLLSLRFLIPNLHPICTCSCLFTPLTEGRSARDLTQAATSQKKHLNHRF